MIDPLPAGRCGAREYPPDLAPLGHPHLAVPEKPFGLTPTSGFSTAAEIPGLLLPPPAAQARNSLYARGGNSEFRIPNSELVPLYSPLLAGAYSLQRAGNT